MEVADGLDNTTRFSLESPRCVDTAFPQVVSFVLFFTFALRLTAPLSPLTPVYTHTYIHTDSDQLLQEVISKLQHANLGGTHLPPGTPRQSIIPVELLSLCQPGTGQLYKGSRVEERGKNCHHDTVSDLKTEHRNQRTYFKGVILNLECTMRALA